MIRPFMNSTLIPYFGGKQSPNYSMETSFYQHADAAVALLFELQRSRAHAIAPVLACGHAAARHHIFYGGNTCQHAQHVQQRSPPHTDEGSLVAINEIDASTLPVERHAPHMFSKHEHRPLCPPEEEQMRPRPAGGFDTFKNEAS